MDDLELALRLADIADAHTMRAFRAGAVAAWPKADGSLVSAVDMAVERQLRAELSRHRGSDAVVGEEEAGTGSGNRRWLLDPIDHTNNFARGIPVFGTLIALEIDGAVDGAGGVGVVSAPALGRRWWAAAGAGAFTDGGTRLVVSPVADLSEAYLSFAALHVWDRRGKVRALVELAGRCRFTYGSGGFWAHMLVAEGKLEASLDPWGQLWDVAPVRVIVTEAGGRVTDVDGVPRTDGGSAVVTNGLLHQEIIDTLRPKEGRCPD